ncbi:unnamed protein product, partial [Mesorhabditis spiculigera]
MIFLLTSRSKTETNDIDALTASEAVEAIEQQETFIKENFENSTEMDYVREQYFEQLQSRVNLLKKARKDYVTGWFTRKDYQNGFAKLYNGIVPEVFCPNLVRIGNVNDGGKWVCNPKALPDKCAIMSLGVNVDATFEREIQKISNQRCRINSYDPMDPGSAIAGLESLNVHFRQVAIGAEDNLEHRQVSVLTEMQRLSIAKLEMLKIDIELNEFSVMPGLVEKTEFCQIFIEIHGNPEETIDLIVLLAKKGYRMFSYEINGYHHTLSEYSFIHDNCLKQYGAVPVVNYWHLV